MTVNICNIKIIKKLIEQAEAEGKEILNLEELTHQAVRIHREKESRKRRNLNYRLNHPEKVMESIKKNRELNKDKYNEQMRRYYNNRKEEIQQQRKEKALRKLKENNSDVPSE